jgi:hypothetical protein
MIHETTKRIDRTDDGDYVFRRTITCDTASDAKEATARLNDEVSLSSGHKAHHDIVWEGKGGKLVWNDTYVVDQAEVAIEARNDEWASYQDDIERQCRNDGFIFY